MMTAAQTRALHMHFHLGTMVYGVSKRRLQDGAINLIVSEPQSLHLGAELS